MKLAAYLESIYRGTTGSGVDLPRLGREAQPDDDGEDFPATLELHKSTADTFCSLYAGGEVDRKECGYCLSYAFGFGESRIRYSPKKTGSRSSINLDHFPGNEYFGNVHCHPGPSLGHLGGRAAHSPADVLMFESEVGKPVFIMFVASGCSTNYALVYRKGATKFDAEIVDETRTRTNVDMSEWFDANCPAGNRYQRAEHQNTLASARNINELRLAIQNVSIGGARFAPTTDLLEAAVNDRPIPLYDAYAVYLKQRTPGFGRYAEQQSIHNMEWFAATMDFGFYRSDERKPNVLVKIR